MPRNGSGTYIQPAGTAGVDGEVIYATPYNNLIADIGNELTNSINVSGTKAMAAPLPMGNNRVILMADPASAQDGATKNYVDTQISSKVTTFIGGTTTGTASAQVLATVNPNTFALVAGNRIVFTPGFTPTGATTLAITTPAIAAKNILKMSPLGLLPLAGGEMIAGQVTEVLYDGTQYVLLQNVAAETGPRTSLASAATTDLGTIGSRNILITGTTTITSFGSAASTGFPLYFLTFANTLLLTHNGTSLILPGAGSIVTSAGDTAIALYLGSGNWQVVSYQVAASGPAIWPLGTIYGLTLSRPTATTVGIAAGGCRNEDTGPGYNMVLSSAITKGLGSWAVGSGNGGLDTGTIAASTWYHVHLIRKDSDGSIDALLSLSATTPTMPSGYTARRRLGSILTNASSQVVAFQQVGNQFIWDVPVVDVSATAPGTAAVTRTLTVPTGVGVEADLIIALMQQAGTATSVWVSPLLITDTPAGTPGGVPLDGPYQVSSLVSGGLWTSSPGRVRTNMSAQVRSRLSASGASIRFGLVTLGWFDARGGN